MSTDIDPRIVPIRTAALWARRGLVLFFGLPFLAFASLTPGRWEDDIEVLRTFWRR